MLFPCYLTTLTFLAPISGLCMLTIYFYDYFVGTMFLIPLHAARALHPRKIFFHLHVVFARFYLYVCW